MSKNKDPSSLLNLQREYIINQIKSVQKPGSLYNLILDEKTEQVLYNVLTKENLLRIVASVEKIDVKRRQNSFMEAIYLIDLSVYNLKCITADLQTKRYKGGYGLFLPILPSDTELNRYYNSNKFMGNPGILNYFNNGLNIKFINASFYPLETRVFLTDNKTPNSMPIYYNQNCAEFILPQVKLAAKALVNLMVITGEYPLIRFYSPPNATHEASRLPELIADEFQRQIDDYARLNHDYPPPSLQDRPRSILLITDRTLDLYAPLLHEFSYQAMAMDIVPSLERTGKYNYQTENELGEIQNVESILQNEDDEDWVSLRHLHIIESSELIINKINDMIKKNPLMIDRSKASNSSDLMYIVAHLKGFDEERKQMTLHKKLIDECLDTNSSRKLAEFAADFEQTCAAGGTSFENERNKHLHDDLIELLARDDLHVNDKMRLVLIYGLYRGGLIEADFIKLVKFIGVNNRQIVSLISRCFTNLHKLGFPIVKKDPKDKRVEMEMQHTINNEGTYNTSRFGPALKSVVQSAAKYQLDEETFPYFRDKPLEEDAPSNVNRSSSVSANASVRNPRIKASWAVGSTNRTHLSLGSMGRPKQRIFCYIAGGMTYSETRSIYELSSTLSKDFYIGSESILKPRDFLIGLQSIDSVKTPLDLDLNLLKEANKPRDPPMFLFDDGLPKLLPQEPGNNISVPSHYQTRLSTVNPEPLSPPLSSDTKTKEKKRSKLKSLFR